MANSDGVVVDSIEDVKTEKVDLLQPDRLPPDPATDRAIRAWLEETEVTCQMSDEEIDAMVRRALVKGNDGASPDQDRLSAEDQAALLAEVEGPSEGVPQHIGQVSGQPEEIPSLVKRVLAAGNAKDAGRGFSKEEADRFLAEIRNADSKATEVDEPVTDGMIVSWEEEV